MQTLKHRIGIMDGVNVKQHIIIRELCDQQTDLLNHNMRNNILFNNTPGLFQTMWDWDRMQMAYMMILSPQDSLSIDHMAGVCAVFPPLHTVYAYEIGKAVSLNNFLAQKSSTSDLDKIIENGEYHNIWYNSWMTPEWRIWWLSFADGTWWKGSGAGITKI